MTQTNHPALERNLNEIMNLNGLTRDEAFEAICDYYANEVGPEEGLAEWQIEALLRRDGF